MTRRASEALYDSEAALRLVDSTLADMTGEAAPPVPVVTRAPLAELTERVAQGCGELIRTLTILRQSRDVMARSTVERLSATNDKLHAVSAATEEAATGLMDGIEAAVGIVDALDALGPDAAGEGVALRATLRDKLYELMGHLQFQDITSQQLAYASAVMSEVEGRLGALVSLLDPAGETVAATAAPTGAFDPDASVEGRGERQALADALVAARAL